MRRTILIILLTALFVIKAEINEKPKVFIDCSSCDLDFIRTEISFVDYVIERQVSDIFVMLKTQSNGGGGSEYTLEFAGRNHFENKNDTLKFTAKQDDSSDIIRKNMVKYIKIGLAYYISRTDMADNIEITYSEKEAKKEVKDDWDSWVFSIGGNGYFNGEKSYRDQSISGYFTSRRITEEWIFDSSYYASFSERRYDYPDYKYFTSSESHSVDLSAVKSMTAHWSSGLSLGGSSSTYSNKELSIYLYPRIEYNIFPYSEANTRELRFIYGIVGVYYKYYKTTIYDKNEEYLSKQSLEIAYEIKKEWGNIILTLSGSSYFHDFEKNRFDAYSYISVRVIKGLSFNVNAGFTMLHDQLSLIKGDVSEDDLILRRKEMETSYSYWSSVGLSYTFGSIYNNVVNPRFGY